MSRSLGVGGPTLRPCRTCCFSQTVGKVGGDQSGSSPCGLAWSGPNSVDWNLADLLSMNAGLRSILGLVGHVGSPNGLLTCFGSPLNSATFKSDLGPSGPANLEFKPFHLIWPLCKWINSPFNWSNWSQYLRACQSHDQPNSGHLSLHLLISTIFSFGSLTTIMSDPFL